MSNVTVKNTELASFHFVFQLSKTIIFEVNYYRCGNNTNKYFTTSAAEFNRPKTDYCQCGQAQKDLLKGFAAAMTFYTKFDPLHLEDLTAAQYAEILADIEALKAKYNYLEKYHEPTFSDCRILSKMPLKRLLKKIA